MALSRASALFWWSAQHGVRAAVGGLPHFTRNSSAYGTALDGSPVPAVVNTPRFEWVTLADGTRRPALRLERAATNSVPYNIALAANWSSQAVTSVVDGVLDPLGGLTASRVTNSGGGASGVYHGLAAPGSASRWAASVSLRRQRSAAGSMGVGLYGSVSGWRGRILADYDANGKRTSGPYITHDNNTRVFPITAESNGFERFEMACDLLNESHFLYVWTEEAAAASVVDVWAPQYESYLPTSRILTPSSASVSRAVESFFWDFPHRTQPAVYYVRLAARGIALPGSNAAGHILFIGVVGGATPYVQLYGYNGSFLGGAGDGSAGHSVAAVGGAVGDEVELVLVHHANGTGTLIRSLGRGASVRNNDATVVGFGAPGAARLYLNSAETVNVGQVDALDLRIVRYGDLANTDVTSDGAADLIMQEVRGFLLSPTGEVL